MRLQKYLKNVYQVDAFTTEAFKGNPAGVVLCDQTINTQLMQNIAAEMNVSETAFVSEGDDCFQIRFFTPISEVPLCGHASLAAAHILYETAIVSKSDFIRFKSPKYEIHVRYDANLLRLELPAYKISSTSVSKEFVEITGLHPDELYKSEHGWHLAYFKDKADIVRAHPHFNHMKHSDFGHLTITSAGEKKEGCDILVRCFAPAIGIDEDPVTGSAQCLLLPFWKMKTGKTEFMTYQASKRTGKISARFIDDNKIEIAGQAVTLIEGKLRI